jgi:hypothetical protein
MHPPSPTSIPNSVGTGGGGIDGTLVLTRGTEQLIQLSANRQLSVMARLLLIVWSQMLLPCTGQWVPRL